MSSITHHPEGYLGDKQLKFTKALCGSRSVSSALDKRLVTCLQCSGLAGDKPHRSSMWDNKLEVIDYLNEPSLES